MIIRGFRQLGHWFVWAYAILSKPPIEGWVKFMVDPGATTTSLIAEVVGMSPSDYRKLEKGSPTLTAKGPITPRKIRDLALLLITEEGRPHLELLKEAEVLSLKPLLKYPEEYRFGGLLGSDLLDRFNTAVLRRDSVEFQK